MNANVTANCVHPGIVRTRLIRDRDGLITSASPLLIPSPASLHFSITRDSCVSSVLSIAYTN
jgi:NAD(P)-dependent dehydrogenase (short-subunit alcohol dehydrogenase family)